jgi:predicted nucleic acid-binding protein
MDLNDAVNLAIMERNGIEDIYTFDKSFARSSWTRRKG